MIVMLLPLTGCKENDIVEQDNTNEIINDNTINTDNSNQVSSMDNEINATENKTYTYKW